MLDKLYYLDLFSGIGGFALGAFLAGVKFDCHYFSEVDNYAVTIYQKRFPEAAALGDIRTIRAKNLPKGRWVLSGGFPCQDISCAGKGVGLGGGRSGLWFEYARLIGELRPEFAFVENVGALAFRGLDQVLGALAEIGYDAEWQDIRASDVGAPHKRERVYIAAYPARKRWGAIQTHKISAYRKSCGEKYPNWSDVQFTSAGNYSVQLQKGDESFICGMDDGLPFWLDRLNCAGNAVVPQITRLIWLAVKEYL